MANQKHNPEGSFKGKAVSNPSPADFIWKPAYQLEGERPDDSWRWGETQDPNARPLSPGQVKKMEKNC